MQFQATRLFAKWRKTYSEHVIDRTSLVADLKVLALSEIIIAGSPPRLANRRSAKKKKLNPRVISKWMALVDAQVNKQIYTYWPIHLVTKFREYCVNTRGLQNQIQCMLKAHRLRPWCLVSQAWSVDGMELSRFYDKGHIFSELFSRLHAHDPGTDPGTVDKVPCERTFAVPRTVPQPYLEQFWVLCEWV